MSRDTNSVSVINGSTNKIDTSIAVGVSPYHVEVDTSKNRIYVSNYGSDTISVIDGSTNGVIDDVGVGRFPYNIEINPSRHIIYVTNLGSNTISEINGTSNKILVGITFNVNPPDGGYIICNEIPVSGLYINDELGSDLYCRPQANSEYKFSAWSGTMSEDLADSSVLGLKADKYGELTANFIVPTSITIPPEYFLSLYAIIISIILSPIITDLLFKRRERKQLGKFIKEIETRYETLHYDRDQCSQSLEEIRTQIINLLEKGKMNDSIYNILDGKISNYINKLNQSKPF